MPAHRKLDAHAVEQIVAARAAGTSYRQIAASLNCTHSTVSRRVASDPELHFRLAAARKREARRARDRERKARAKARREAALGPASPPEHGQRPPAGPSPGEELLAPAPQLAPEPARLPPGLASPPFPGPVRRGRRQRERALAALPRGSLDPMLRSRPDLVSLPGEGERQAVDPDEVEASLPRGEQEAARVSRTRPHGRRDELRAARRILLAAGASFRGPRGGPGNAPRAARRHPLERPPRLLAAAGGGEGAHEGPRLPPGVPTSERIVLEWRRRAPRPGRPRPASPPGGPRWLAANERVAVERTRAGAAEPDIEHELGRERHELEAAARHQPADRDEPAQGRDRLPFSPQPRTVRVGRRDLLLFPDTPEGAEARFAYYEERRLVDPPHSILDSNDVRRGRLTALERAHLRRMGR